MSQIEYPYHLALPTIISIIIIVVIILRFDKPFKNRHHKWGWSCAILFFIIYGLIVGYSTIEDINRQVESNKYDLNKDGIFTENEITKDQEYAYFKLTNDTGLNLSPITGLFFSLIVTAPIFLVTFFRKEPKQRENNQNYT